MELSHVYSAKSVQGKLLICARVFVLCLRVCACVASLATMLVFVLVVCACVIVLV